MIAVQDLSKCYTERKKPSVQAIDALNFCADAGKITAILGPNGSGKTTLLRMISTLLQPDKGTIKVAGFNTQTQSQQVRACVGFVTGTAALHQKLTARESLEFFCHLHGIGRQEMREKVAYWIDELDMAAYANRTAEGLSMGQKQRIMIARALLHEPQVIVFDEATTGLDVIASEAFFSIVKRCKKEGKTVLFSTHIMGEVSLLADEVLILNQGKLCFSGSFQLLEQQRQAPSLEAEFLRLLKSKN